MNIINKKIIQSQNGSALTWLLIVLLIVSSLFAWYMYLQTDNELIKNIKQKERIQQRYTQKSDELYDLLSKLQKIQNKNDHLNNQSKLCSNKTKQLNSQLQLQLEKDQKQTQDFLLCNNKNSEFTILLQEKQRENKELIQKIEQQVAQNKLQTKEIQKKCEINISTEIDKYDQCQSSIKLALIDNKKAQQQLLHYQNLHQEELKNTLQLQDINDAIKKELISHREMLKTSSTELEEIKKQFILSQEVESDNKKEYEKMSQLLKKKSVLINDLTKKYEQTSSERIKLENKNNQLKIKLEILQNDNKKLEDNLKKGE